MSVTVTRANMAAPVMMKTMDTRASVLMDMREPTVRLVSLPGTQWGLG
jgi:hypothetical protein